MTHVTCVHVYDIRDMTHVTCDDVYDIRDMTHVSYIRVTITVIVTLRDMRIDFENWLESETLSIQFSFNHIPCVMSHKISKV